MLTCYFFLFMYSSPNEVITMKQTKKADIIALMERSKALRAFQPMEAIKYGAQLLQFLEQEPSLLSLFSVEQRSFFEKIKKDVLLFASLSEDNQRLLETLYQKRQQA